LDSPLSNDRVLRHLRTKHLDEVMKFNPQLFAEFTGFLEIFLGNERCAEFCYSIFHTTMHGAAVVLDAAAHCYSSTFAK
jgi:hypothetical protein